MPNEQLLTYIRQRLAAGVERPAIIQELIKTGWKVGDVDVAINEASPVLGVSSKKPKHRILKVMLCVLGSIFGLVVIVLLVPNVLGLVYKDIPPIDDSDLMLQSVSIEEGANAFFDLEKAAKSSDSAQIDLLLSASERAFYQDPAFANPSNVSYATEIPISLNGVRDAIRANNAYAIDLAASKGSLEGLRQALIGVAIASKIERSQSTLIEQLVAIAAKNLALDTIQEIISDSSSLDKEAEKLAAELSAYSNDGTGFMNAVKLGYLEHKSMIQTLAHGEVMDDEKIIISSVVNRTNFYFFPNESTSYFANLARGKVVLAKASCEDLDSEDIVQHLGPNNSLLYYITPNAVGKVLYNVVASTLSTLKKRICEENTKLEATVALLKSKI